MYYDGLQKMEGEMADKMGAKYMAKGKSKKTKTALDGKKNSATAEKSKKYLGR